MTNTTNTSIYKALDEKIQMIYTLDKLYNLNRFDINFPTYDVFINMWWSKYYSDSIFSDDIRIRYYIFVINEYILKKVLTINHYSRLCIQRFTVTKIIEDMIYYNEYNFTTMNKCTTIDKFFELIGRRMMEKIK